MTNEQTETGSDKSIAERTEKFDPEERKAYLDGLVGKPEDEGAEIGKSFTRDPEKATVEAEQEQRDREISEKTGIPQEYVSASFDLFTSAESPLDLSENEIEGLLVNLAKQPDAIDTLDNLFNASNDHNKMLWQDVSQSIGASDLDLADIEEDEEGQMKGVVHMGLYNKNNILHLSNTFHQVMNRCHRESLDYNGLTESLSDSRIKRALDTADFNGKWYRVQDIKDIIANASTGGVEEPKKRFGELHSTFLKLQETTDKVMKSSVGWGANEK